MHIVITGDNRRILILVQIVTAYMSAFLFLVLCLLKCYNSRVMTILVHNTLKWQEVNQ